MVENISLQKISEQKSHLPVIKKGFLYELKKNRLLTLMALPSVIFVFLFSYTPMIGIILAFKNYTYSAGIFGSDWVGFANFKFFFVTGVAGRVTLNTILYNLAFTAVDIVLQISAAIIISELVGRYFKKITQTMILLPFFVSWVVVGAIVFNTLNYDTGFINNLLVSLGYEKMDFLNNTIVWPILFVLFHAWKGFGYGSVVYLAAITGIDQDIYEAAKIDGANVFQRIFEITLPCLKPTVIILLLLGLGNIIKGDFGMFYNLTGNNPMLYNVTDIVDTFVFRSLMKSQDFGMSTAAGLYQSALGLVIILTVNTIIKKVQPEYALF